MDFDTSTLMMIAFIIAMIVSIWKLYAFMPNKQLEDDDTTQEAKDELLSIVLKNIKKYDGKLSMDELYVKIQEDEDFDSKRFWRFNENKLRQILNLYCTKNPHVQNSIEAICQNLKAQED